MRTTVYVPRDAASLSNGAEAVAAAIAAQAQKRDAPIRIIRNGSRGLNWLEPLVEVDTSSGRYAYGPVGIADVASLFDANFLAAGKHALSLGPTEEIS
jgi:formate dehydrogenase iron-sulfur subunit